MSYRFKILYNKITKFDAPGYKDRELSNMFNIVQLELVKQFYTPQGNKYGKGFENTEKRRKDLSNLIRNVYLTSANYSISQIDNHKNGTMFDLPVDMLWTIQEECYMNVNNINCIAFTPQYDPRSQPILPNIAWSDLKIIKVKPITHDEYNLNVENPFRRPYSELIWRLDYYSTQTAIPQLRHELIDDSGYTILRYRIRYLKKPIDIIVDTQTPLNMVNCELISTMHDEIIIRTVEMATGITVPEEYKIKNIEEVKSE